MLLAADTDKNPPKVGSFAGQQGYIVIAYLKKRGGGAGVLKDNCVWLCCDTDRGFGQQLTVILKLL